MLQRYFPRRLALLVLALVVSLLGAVPVVQAQNPLDMPSIDSFAPTSGAVGTSVTIYYNGMTAGGEPVRFNGVLAGYVPATATGSFTVVVPSGATTGRITLEYSGGMATSSTDFTVPVPPPTVTSRTPARNARAASRSTTVGLGFSTALDPATAGNVKVFSQQYRGRRTATAALSNGGSTVTLTPTVPATGSQVADFKPGETVFVTVPATVQSTGGAAATKHVYQFTAAATGGTGNFGGGSNPAVGANTQSVAVGDGDGDLDLLTANGSRNGTVSVRLNNGSGVFSGGSDPAVGSYPYSVAVGDVDGDGDLDLLTANSGDYTLSVRLNNGAGTFTAPATNPNLAVGSFPTSVALGDVDGDGDLDLLAANVSSTVNVRLNPPTISSFTPPAGPVGTSVVITGASFTGATQVKFNTTAATTYTVNSATQITATVPAGATTGAISVTTAVGTGSSGSSLFTVWVPLVLTGSPTNVNCNG